MRGADVGRQVLQKEVGGFGTDSAVGTGLGLVDGHLGVISDEAWGDPMHKHAEMFRGAELQLKGYFGTKDLDETGAWF